MTEVYMRAMILNKVNTPLIKEELPIPQPGGDEVLIQVFACAVCRTDLHIWLGELSPPHLPLILGHQVVGKIVKIGSECKRFKIGDIVGAPWLAKSCQHCSFCLEGNENLCDAPLFRGYQINGGFAEYCLAYEDYIFSIPSNYSAEEVTPLLCGGLIGYRSLRMAGQAKNIGFYGFGSAAHVLTQVAIHQGQHVYAFTRPGDTKGQEFSRSLGALWAGGSDQTPPEKLDAAILFAPVGDLVPIALKAVKKGGKVICAGIHMSEIPAFSYDLLYGERSVQSVTNLTRKDGTDFFELAKKIPLKTHVTVYPLEKTNQALQDLKEGKLMGSAVISLL
jgi:alcohol dehydrogenase, propanol-preferring